MLDWVLKSNVGFDDSLKLNVAFAKKFVSYVRFHDILEKNARFDDILSYVGFNNNFTSYVSFDTRCARENLAEAHLTRWKICVLKRVCWPLSYRVLDDRELYNQIIDIRREIARPEALVMIVTTTTYRVQPFHSKGHANTFSSLQNFNAALHSFLPPPEKQALVEQIKTALGVVDYSPPSAPNGKAAPSGLPNGGVVRPNITFNTWENRA